MTSFITIIAFLLCCVGIFLILGLNKQRITEDILSFLVEKNSLRQEVFIRQHKAKKKKFKTFLIKLREALLMQGKGHMFAVVCMVAILLAIIGVIVAIAIDNVYLTIPLALIFGSFPFFYAQNTIRKYDERVTNELETALSIITTAYIRTDDIVSAIEENIGYIAPPLNKFFKQFVGECTAIRSDNKKAIWNLKSKIDNEIFADWCDALISCQDDRSLKVTLLPIVSKMTDVRIVNEELKIMIAAARSQYYTMVGLALGSIPLLYLLNKDWFDTLVNTDPGKIVLAITFFLIFVTMIFLGKFSKPIQYRG